MTNILVLFNLFLLYIITCADCSPKWHPVPYLFLATLTRADSLRARAYTTPSAQNDNDQITMAASSPVEVILLYDRWGSWIFRFARYIAQHVRQYLWLSEQLSFPFWAAQMWFLIHHPIQLVSRVVPHVFMCRQCSSLWDEMISPKVKPQL